LTNVSITNEVAGRRVDLVGEAHFEIVPNAHAAFVVRIGTVDTRVLGTTFDIRQYRDDREGRIVVREGKVRASGATSSVVLSAGMRGRFTDARILIANAADSTDYTNWGSNELVFHDTPLAVVLKTLERWYGYSFRLSDSTLATEKVTAVFDIGDTPEMIRRLTHILGVGMTVHDSIVTLHGRGTFRALRRTRMIPPNTPPFTEVGR
jgi:ferric-dicitrate binding protein FerR (iron transport regulator)